MGARQRHQGRRSTHLHMGPFKPCSELSELNRAAILQVHATAEQHTKASVTVRLDVAGKGSFIMLSETLTKAHPQQEGAVSAFQFGTSWKLVNVATSLPCSIFLVLGTQEGWGWGNAAAPSPGETALFIYIVRFYCVVSQVRYGH